jgi:hypothetical protein
MPEPGNQRHKKLFPLSTQSLAAKTRNLAIRKSVPFVYALTENGRCAHPSGPMIKMLASIHRFFGT